MDLQKEKEIIARNIVQALASLMIENPLTEEQYNYIYKTCLNNMLENNKILDKIELEEKEYIKRR